VGRLRLLIRHFVSTLVVNWAVAGADHAMAAGLGIERQRGRASHRLGGGPSFAEAARIVGEHVEITPSS